MRAAAFLIAAVPIVAAGLIASTICASAQRYVMRDGTILDVAKVERRGNVLVEPLTDPEDEGVAERLHALSDVVRLDWPEPEALMAAREQLDQGAPEVAIASVAPVLEDFIAFPDVDGSWWDEAALIKAQALLAAGRSAEAAPLVQALVAAQPDPEVQQLSRLLFVEIDLDQGRTELASAMLKQIAEDEGLPSALAARVWWLRGDVFFRRDEFEQALEAYLHVPAFFGRERSLRPAVLLGSARAYREFGDGARADRALSQLLTEYPQHPLALQARQLREATPLPSSP